MKVKFVLLIIGIFLPVLLSGFLLQPNSPLPNTIELKVVKINNVWKVIDATDPKIKEIKAHKKDTIIWTVEGTNASFQFPEGLFDPVGSADSLTNGYTKFIKNGKKLKLKIKYNALPGTYEYAVFCTKDGVFARGDSPPKIIIQ
jgi:hypothetical protein